MDKKVVRRRKPPDVEKTCATCGVTFWVKACRENTAKYCGPACQHKARTGLSYECQHCGTLFHPWQEIQKFCSQECYRASKKSASPRRTITGGSYYVPPPRQKRACLRCGKKFYSWGPGNRSCLNCRDVAGAHITPEMSINTRAMATPRP